MHIDWDTSDANALGVVRATIQLTSNETTELLRGAYLRFARAFGFKEDYQKARLHMVDMLTEQEQDRYLSQLIMAQAADDALTEMDALALFSPTFQSNGAPVEGLPFVFSMEVLVLPGNLRIDISELDLDPESSDASLAHSCGQELSSSLPDAHLKAAVASVREQFERDLARNNQTVKEYRIEHHLTPEAFQDELLVQAIDELASQAALDCLYLQEGLEVSAEDENAVLRSIAGDQAEALRTEMIETGRLHNLYMQARREHTLGWIREHLF